MWTAAFWKAAAERALKTFAQFAAVLFVPYLAAGDGLDLTAVPWLTILGYAVGGALASVLTSLASAQVGNSGPSLANEVVVSGRAAR
jgi:hypothetical protein